MHQALCKHGAGKFIRIGKKVFQPMVLNQQKLQFMNSRVAVVMKVIVLHKLKELWKIIKSPLD